MTALNWMGEPIERLELTVRVPFQVRAAEGVRAGTLKFEAVDGGVKLALPLNAADVVMLRPRGGADEAPSRSAHGPYKIVR